MSEGPLFAAGAAEGPARRALALGVRSEVSQRERDELASLLDLADAGFYELARSHVLGPVVFSRLNELQMLDLLDEKTATRLKRDYGVAAMRATSLASDLADVLRALERSGVAPAPIKGAALAWDLYPEPGCRPMSAG